MNAPDHIAESGVILGPKLTPRWLTPRRAVIIIAAVSAAVHILACGSMPLIVPPDGREYSTYAFQLLDGGPEWHSPNRTPGYPAMLAIAFAIMGRNAIAILVMNHLLAWLTCVMVAVGSVRIAGARWGLLSGLLFAIEPWSLAYSSFACTETPTIFVTTAAAVALLCWRPDRIRSSVGMAVLLVAVCMMRPALQSMAPFMGLAWLLRIPGSIKRCAVLAGVLVGVFVAVSLPWLVFNARHGVRGFARGSNSALWYGVGFFGMLDPAYPMNEQTRKVFDKYLAGRAPDDDSLCRVMYDTHSLEDAAQDKHLGDWAKSSIRKRPVTYAFSCFYTLLWQLNCGMYDKPPMYDEFPFFARRPFQPRTRSFAPNFQGAGQFPGWEGFVMNSGGSGVLAPYMLWWGQNHVRGVPQVPLAIATLAAVIVAIRRRRWELASLGLATFALVGAHCVLLMPVTRYSMPSTTLWYISAAWVLSVGVPHLRTMVRGGEAASSSPQQ